MSVLMKWVVRRMVAEMVDRRVNVGELMERRGMIILWGCRRR